MNRRRLSAICIFLALAVSVSSQDLSKISRPEQAGFSSERLSRITQFFKSEVDQGAIPGAVLVVARNGKVVYREAIGYQDREKKIPMKPDAIFRIFSMTKPVASVAVMMLVEEGKIDVMAPVAQYLPEFKDVKVGVEKTEPATGKPALSLEAPVRPMTVQDLLRHTSGLVYGPFGNTLVHQAYNQANLFDSGQTLAEFVTKISKLPARAPTGDSLGVWHVSGRAWTHRGSGFRDAVRPLPRGENYQAARHG
jgi:CubicO group peptidase (beta-lactamase class C family)